MIVGPGADAEPNYSHRVLKVYDEEVDEWYYKAQYHHWFYGWKNIDGFRYRKQSDAETKVEEYVKDKKRTKSEQIKRKKEKDKSPKTVKKFYDIDYRH